MQDIRRRTEVSLADGAGAPNAGTEAEEAGFVQPSEVGSGVILCCLQLPNG